MKDQPTPEATTAAEQNSQLRRDLLAERRRWNERVPPHLTQDVALSVFGQHMQRYPLATPEVIAVELIARADQWDEVAAISAALRHVLARSDT
jgi:hypothetical protein